jgi:hypothetical protein
MTEEEIKRLIKMSPEELDAEIELIKSRIKARIEKMRQRENCDHCGGAGYDPYPNHATAYPTCPKCNH